MSQTISEALAHRKRRRRQLSIVVAASIGAALLVVGAVWWLTRPEPPSARAAAEELAAAWSAGDPATGPVQDPDAASETYEGVVADLGAEPPDVSVERVDERGDGRATALLQVRWDLGDGHVLAHPTTVTLDSSEDGWLAELTPATVHPSLGEGGRLVRRRLGPERGDILGQGGVALVTARPVVHVGVEPARVQDLEDLVARLADLLDIDGMALAARIEEADEHAFVPVVTLREEDYDAVAAEVQPLPGTVFRSGELPLAPTRGFARPLLGTAGDVTAELVEERPDRYRAGDLAGLSGLQRHRDERLAGSVGFEVVAVPDDGDEEQLYLLEPVDGEDVTVTLDLDVQLAAEAALADVGDHPSAAVVLRVGDGHVLAAANGPAEGGLERALAGRFPPGSTFKVVTTAALLATGLDPEAPVSCPPTATVDGRTFRNAEQGALGDVSFRTAFAQSCNTVFVQLAADLEDDALARAGEHFGLGLGNDLGIGAYGGQVPESEGPVDKAAAAIGQGRNLVSPLGLADVAATVARGQHLPPVLLVEPAPGTEPAAGPPLDPAVADALRSLMRSVVTDGSGAAAAGVPGEPVHGKTGTAEYGDEAPPRTHAWFIAFQGDLAVAVIVAETADGFGGRLAAPIAAELLTRLQ